MFFVLELMKFTSISNRALILNNQLTVLELMKFTSISNLQLDRVSGPIVLELMKFTSISNGADSGYKTNAVLELMKFTSISNLKINIDEIGSSWIERAYKLSPTLSQLVKLVQISIDLFD